MAKLFNAFFFKLRKDLSFRITLFIGIGLAILLSLILLGVELIVNGTLGSSHRLLTGETMLTNSLSPVANFGIAIPVNLITFTVQEEIPDRLTTIAEVKIVADCGGTQYEKS